MQVGVLPEISSMHHECLVLVFSLGENIRSHGTVITVGGEQLWGYWEEIAGPLEEKPMLLACFSSS